MWTGGRRTKTNPKTSPEQSAIFQLVREISKTNAKTVTSIVFDHISGHFHDDWAKNVTSRETNVLTKFHENWAKNVTSRVFTCFHYIHKEKNAPPTGGHVFSPIWTILEISIKPMKTAPPTGGHVFQRTRTNFKLDQHIIKTNILTNFELDRGIVGTNLLTMFHEDRTRNVASRVFTKKTAPPTGGHVFQRT
ncbi:hypothetical protein DPMN_153709 [Dreissena polymorpha]|uniref:Uncharacterized protein n=1 Tax=Dreissena polymorpha TaxID=45954 RepID=A0A9D4FM21_DREPO|nr:hypothetical protein DPMN_153709 [Dreissena polymorpha]